MATLAILLAGCAASPAAPSANWLHGSWLAQAEGERSLSACVGGSAVSYFADGSFTHWEWSGRWRLDGDQLTEIATLDHEIIPPEEVPINKPMTSRIERIDANEMSLWPDGGEAVTYLRCPAVR